MAGVDALALATGRIGDAGAPAWWGALLLVLAVLALAPSRTRVPVLVCWTVALVSVLLAAGLSVLTFDLATTRTGAGLGFPVVALQAAYVVAAVLGAHGLRLAGARALVVAVAAAALVLPTAGLVWFVLGGESELRAEEQSDIPVYMVQNAELGPEHGILVLRGTVEEGLDYTVLREDGITLGEDEVVALAAEDTALTADVRTLVAGPEREAVRALAGHGVEYVVLPAPADGRVASVLDATGGLVQASAEDRSTRAWKVGAELDPEAVDGPRSWLRVGLLVLQGVAILVVVVLCAPTVTERRSA
jgi:hypothetical protein